MMKEITQAYGKRLILIGVIIACVSSQGYLYTGTAKAASTKAAYSCGDLLSNHCYGTNDWFGPNGSWLGGGQTDIVVVPLNCNNCDSNAIASDELWVTDQNSYQASQCLKSKCWLEVGYEADQTGDDCSPTGFWTQCYFWADNRPNGGFYEHPSGLPSDNYTHHTRMKIKNIDCCDWYVSINPLASSDGGVTGTSTNNNIYPQHETIGAELGGSNGVTAQAADYVHNEWADANKVFYYQTNPGCLNSTCYPANPPEATWYQQPNCCNSGGDMEAWIQ